MKTKEVYNAAKQGDLDTIKNYLEKKRVPADVRKKIASIGAEKDDVDLLKFTLMKDPSMVDYVLRHAVEYGALNAVRYLVETCNANILKHQYSKYSHAYSTVVDIAAEKGYLNILKYFVEDRNIDIDTPIESQRRPLHFRALECKRYNIVEYLIEKKKANLTMLDYEGQHILYTAAYNCDLKFMKYVLDERKANIDVNQKNKAGKSLLLKVACWWDCFEILEYLVEQKHVNIRSADEHSKGSPLHCVRSAKTCTYLLEHGANIIEKDIDGDTPLHRIIDRIGSEHFTEASVRIFECLIKHGADVNLQNTFGITPLNLACSTHSNYTYEMCKCLVEHGANVNSKDDRFKNSPLHTVIMYSRSRPYPPDIDLIEYLIEHGADVNDANDRGNTPLHVAVLNKDIEVCKYLIEQGADTNKSNHMGETPLHIAALGNCHDICKHLINKGACRQAKDNDGRIPVQRASDRALIEYMKKAPKRKKPTVHTSEKYLSCPECGAKFTRIQRSASIPPSVFSSSSDIYIYRRSKITSSYSRNVNHTVNDLPISFSSAYLSHFRGFLTLIQLLITNANTSSIHSFWSPKTILENRMDPLAEDVISSTPISFEETYYS